MSSHLLALQRAAGNAAVASAISWPDERTPARTVARAPAGTIAPSTPKPTPKRPLFEEEEAKEIQERWSEGGVSTQETGDLIETREYFLWRKRAKARIEEVKGLYRRYLKNVLNARPMPGAVVTEDPVPRLRAWIAAFEARERALVSPAGPRLPPVPGELPAEFGQLKDPPTPAYRLVERYTVTVPGREEPITYDEAVRPGKGGVSPGHPALRKEAGSVAHVGTKLGRRKKEEMDGLFTAAGIADEDKKKAILKVAGEEGGFAAMNTWDVGLISVGAIQYIERDGNLSALLRQAKKADPGNFKTYFHDLGIDVDQQGLVVVHPDSGAILKGPAAIQAIQDDKRLTAAFTNAGENWRTFQVEQLRKAIADYWVADDAFTLKVSNSLTITGKIGEVLTSEAGRVALFDNAVNRGAGGARKRFREICLAVAKRRDVVDLAELASWERAIVKALTHRVEVLQDPQLGQPPGQTSLPAMEMGAGEHPA